jgi:hypothetical protein
LAALVEVSMASQSRDPQGRERGGDSAGMAAASGALPPPCSWQQLQLGLSEERRGEEHVFLASSGSEASMASRVGAPTPTGSRRRFPFLS